MDFTAIMPALQAQRPTPAFTPNVQAAVVPVAANLQAATLTRTQTTMAATASGRSDGSRSSQSGTQTDQSVDSQANTLRARANGAPRRGSALDVSV
jgi:hypothetical protein